MSYLSGPVTRHLSQSVLFMEWYKKQLNKILSLFLEHELYSGKQHRCHSKQIKIVILTNARRAITLLHKRLLIKQCDKTQEQHFFSYLSVGLCLSWLSALLLSYFSPQLLSHSSLCVFCSSLPKIKAHWCPVTNSLEEGWTDIKKNLLWHLTKKCVGMLRSS